MRTFTEEPKATQQAKSDNALVRTQPHFGHDREVKSILHLQRAIGNQAVQRQLPSNEELNVELSSTDLPRFGDEFSRIPIRFHTVGAIQPKLAINNLGDEYEQEVELIADRVMRMPEPKDLLARARDRALIPLSLTVPTARMPLSPSPSGSYGAIQRYIEDLPPQRVARLRRMARNPQNFAGRWPSNSDEQSVVIEEVDRLYGREFTDAFVRFAEADAVIFGLVQRRNTRTDQPPAGIVPGIPRGAEHLWRRARFEPSSFAQCENWIHPNGTRFARCRPAAAPQADAAVVRSAVSEAQRLQSAGDIPGAAARLEQARSAVERMELRTARAHGLAEGITDPERVIDFFLRRGASFLPVPLPSEVRQWRELRNRLGRASESDPLSDEALVDDLLEGLQPKRMDDAVEDRYEREADQIAARVVDSGSTSIASPLQVTPRIQGKANSAVDSTPAWVAAAVASGGHRLPVSTREYFETRFGHDFSAVRAHDGPTAGAAARQINARAFTLGRHIAFAPGAYQPHTQAGRRLIAHELTHTLQQQPVATLQRQADERAITARDVFPVEQGARLQVLRTMQDVWFDLLRSQEPATARTLEAIENRIAEVTTATDDVFEASLAGEVQVPSAEGSESRTVASVRIRLARAVDGTFTLQITGEQRPSGTLTILYSADELVAVRDAGGIVLSRGSVPQFRTSPVERGSVSLRAFTAPYLEQAPEALRALAPERLDLIEMRRLPDVEAGSSEEVAAIEANAARARARTTFQSQRLTLGTGILVGEQLNPLLQASWQINFRPFETTGGFVQIPLRVSIQYAPSASVIGRVTSGVETSFAQLGVPINVQIIAGIAGGRVEESDLATGASGPPRPVVGLPLGAGVGLEVDAFRMDLRYDYLINLLEGNPNLHTVALQLGGSF